MSGSCCLGVTAKSKENQGKWWKGAFGRRCLPVSELPQSIILFFASPVSFLVSLDQPSSFPITSISQDMHDSSAHVHLGSTGNKAEAGEVQLVPIMNERLQLPGARQVEVKSTIVFVVRALEPLPHHGVRLWKGSLFSAYALAHGGKYSIFQRVSFINRSFFLSGSHRLCLLTCSHT